MAAAPPNPALRPGTPLSAQPASRGRPPPSPGGRQAEGSPRRHRAPARPGTAAPAPPRPAPGRAARRGGAGAGGCGRGRRVWAGPGPAPAGELISGPRGAPERRWRRGASPGARGTFGPGRAAARWVRRDSYTDKSRGAKLKLATGHNTCVFIDRFPCSLLSDLSIYAMDVPGEQQLDVEHKPFNQRLDKAANRVTPEAERHGKMLFCHSWMDALTAFPSPYACYDIRGNKGRLNSDHFKHDKLLKSL
ncbi:translation initiation factor IF-2-like [Falco biarmicus]|uniref:translation initiation factor IF-2-like n=1 Tax=Falco biarmicus TaxID=345155 RepID=UPI0024BC7FBA|nr:translation initiation factor IF-2-like [Falco biarmicus]